MNLNTELEIIQKKKNGYSTKDICKEYNITKAIFYGIIHRNGKSKIISNKKYSADENFFENIDTEEKAYWLGFLYADGYIASGKSDINKQRSWYVEIGLSSSDRKHVELFSKCLNSTYPIKNRTTSKTYFKKDNTNCVSTHIKITNKKMVKDLVDKGCTSNKSWTITYPNFLNKSLEGHFIRGFFDGDGSIRKRGPNQYEVSVYSNINFIKGLNSSLKNIFSIGSYIIQRHDRNDLSSLLISNYKDCLSFYNLIYESMKTECFLKRKKDIFDNILIKNKPKTIKTFKIISPDNNIFYTHDGLKKFCIETGLNYRCMKDVSAGRRTHHKGWKIEKILSENNIYNQMIYLKTYEQFNFLEDDVDVDVLEPITKIKKKIVNEPKVLGIQEDIGSYVDKRGVVHIKNWKEY